MNRWTNFLMGLCLVLTLAPALGETGSQAEQGRGPYEAVAGSENAVWVVDTRNGRVRKCTQDFSDQKPICSAFSK